MLSRSLLSIALAAAVLPASEASAQSSTIRVEPRPYYGAVVTVEQGVRVWRPLPPTSHMIINPTGSPVHVNVTDVRETVNHQHSGLGSAGSVPSHAYGRATSGAPAYFVGRRPFHHRPHRPGGVRP